MSGKERLEPWASSKWLSKSAAAKYIHRHVDAVQELIESGRFPPSTARSTVEDRGPSTSTSTTSMRTCAGPLSSRSLPTRNRTRSMPRCRLCRRLCQSAWPATAARGPHDVPGIAHGAYSI